MVCSEDCLPTLAVSARAPSVRPWNACVKHTSSEGAVALASYGSIPATAQPWCQSSWTVCYGLAALGCYTTDGRD